MPVQKENKTILYDFISLALILLLFIFVVAIYAVIWKYGKPHSLNFISVTFAQETSSNGQDGDLSNKIREYQQKLDELRRQKNTLSSQIQYMDTQIYLTGLKIKETENKIETIKKEIETSTERIRGMDTSLSYLSRTLIDRITASYKKRQISPLEMIFDGGSMDELINNIKYLKTAQENNQELLIQVQQVKLNFEEQKNIREQKATELDNLSKSLSQQEIDLGNQKIAKQKLLADTNNDEEKYQELLNKAQAEYAAIQGIVSVGGNEIKISSVKKGDFIASIITGPSCNSGGPHTHFIVKDNGVVSNPFNYLKPVSFNNCSGSSCGSSDGDQFNPSGNFDWPLQPSIEFEQGYGSTWAVRNTWVGRVYSFHSGIDINGASNDITAIADGTLYKGSYGGVNGCALPYVKLVHMDSNIITYYLHVYPK